MKIGGVEVTRAEEVLVLPRQGDNLVFKAQAVLDMEAFDALCPKPTPPVRLTKDGKKEHKSGEYLAQLTRWGEQRYAYVLIQSLKPSDIEWGIVKEDDPNSWLKWVDDFKSAGLADTEINRVQQLVLDANALNETKLKAAREAFLVGQGKKA
mgnify:CR=1 FL=1